MDREKREFSVSRKQVIVSIRNFRSLTFQPPPSFDSMTTLTTWWEVEENAIARTVLDSGGPWSHQPGRGWTSRDDFFPALHLCRVIRIQHGISRIHEDICRKEKPRIDLYSLAGSPAQPIDRKRIQDCDQNGVLDGGSGNRPRTDDCAGVTEDQNPEENESHSPPPSSPPRRMESAVMRSPCSGSIPGGKKVVPPEHDGPTQGPM